MVLASLRDFIHDARVLLSFQRKVFVPNQILFKVTIVCFRLLTDLSEHYILGSIPEFQFASEFNNELVAHEMLPKLRAGVL